jgi:hypothetical protein
MNKRTIILIIVAVLVVILAVVFAKFYIGTDLTITQVTAPSNGIIGQNITVNNTIKNRGISGAGPFVVNYYLTKTKNFTNNSTNKILIGTSNINSLAGRTTVQQSTNLTIPDNITNGTYYILAFVDPNNSINELYETNNLAISKKVVIK